jgi:hypothetical protein
MGVLIDVSFFFSIYLYIVCQKQDWKTHKKTCRAPGEEIEVREKGGGGARR